MASGILVNIKEVMTCPICLELLTEPMSLDCGHSFCQACITANNGESLISQGESSCPVCRIRYQPGNLRSSLHLANIVEALREVKLSPQEEQRRDLCGRHGERLLLFCKEDEEVICWLCERSQEHRGHHTFLMEEIAQVYKEKLQKALDSLIAKQQKAEKLGADLEEETTSWKDLIENESQSIQDYFKELRGILDHEEQKELQILEEEERNVLSYLAQGGSELTQKSQLLRDLIWDLQCRLKGSTAEMLQDVNGILERSKTFTLKKLKTLSKEQRRVFQVPDLRGMLQVFNELTEVRRYWANMTLDHQRANSNISINVYEREDYEDHGVLGLPSITSGKHYWEVDVSQIHAWILGVYEKKNHFVNILGNIRLSFRKQCKYHQPVCSRYQPKNGYWVIGLQNNSEYKAFVDSPSSEPSSLTLCPTVPPRRIGVFLDYNDCSVSFLNITNHGFLIYKFSSCLFSSHLPNNEICPYFNFMKCSDSLKLCSPSS